MARKDSDTESLDLKRAAELLEKDWQAVVAEASAKPNFNYIADAILGKAIQASVNHRQVTYRFCLPVQLLGRLTNPTLDSLRLQRKKGDPVESGLYPDQFIFPRSHPNLFSVIKLNIPVRLRVEST